MREGDVAVQGRVAREELCGRVRPTLSPERQEATSPEQVWGEGVSGGDSKCRGDPRRLLLMPVLFLGA